MPRRTRIILPLVCIVPFFSYLFMHQFASDMVQTFKSFLHSKVDFKLFLAGYRVTQSVEFRKIPKPLSHVFFLTTSQPNPFITNNSKHSHYQEHKQQQQQHPSPKTSSSAVAVSEPAALSAVTVNSPLSLEVTFKTSRWWKPSAS